MRVELSTSSKNEFEPNLVELHRRKKPGRLRRQIGKLAEKNRTWIVASGTSAYMVLKTTVYRANAQSIFKPAQDAMSCIVSQATTAGISNSILTNLPFILFTSLTLVFFGYFCYTLAQAIATYGQGQEVTHVIQQPLFTFICVILLLVGEAFFFGSSGGCGTGV